MTFSWQWSSVILGMATVSEDGGAAPSGDGQLTGSVASGEVTVSFDRVKWNPFSSSDWDNEKHTREALVRIKRYSCLVIHGQEFPQAGGWLGSMNELINLCCSVCQSLCN